MVQASLTKTQVNVQIPSRTQLNNSSLKLRLLNDVNSSNLVDGSVIVYNAESDKFVVEPISNAATTIDGGTY